jgi:hypothetical protein
MGNYNKYAGIRKPDGITRLYLSNMSSSCLAMKSNTLHTGKKDRANFKSPTTKTHKDNEQGTKDRANFKSSKTKEATKYY